MAQLPAFEYVMIAARGSSDHAALYAKYAWATFASYFRHGLIATIVSGLPTLLLMPRGAAFDDMLALAGELQQRGAELLVISEDAQALALAKRHCHWPRQCRSGSVR